MDMDTNMNMDMDMDLMTSSPDQSQAQLMEIISQLDSALTNISSPTTPTSQQLAFPSDPFCAMTPSLPSQMFMSSPTTASPEHATREMIYRAAAMRPVCTVDMESVEAPPRRRNVRISNEPQSVAARLRRERVSKRMRVLQRLVPGGTRMDTATMLDEAIRYVKFLKGHLRSLEQAAVAAAAVHGCGGGVVASGEYYSCTYFFS